MSHHFKVPKYIKKVIELQQAKKVMQTAGMHHVRVSHDDWCELLKGKGECNCNPDVSYIATEGNN